MDVKEFPKGLRICSVITLEASYLERAPWGGFPVDVFEKGNNF